MPDDQKKPRPQLLHAGRRAPFQKERAGKERALGGGGRGGGGKGTGGCGRSPKMTLPLGIFQSEKRKEGQTEGIPFLRFFKVPAG